jgi:protein TonB
MSAIAAARNDLMRWAASAVVVVGLHAIGIATLLAWHVPVGWGDNGPAIVIDLALFAPPSDTPEDLAPGPLQQQPAAPAPPERAEPNPEKVDEKLEAKVEARTEQPVEVPPAPVPPVAALPPPETVPPPVAAPEPEAAPVPTAPPRPHPASAAEADAWHKGIYTQIQHHKVYPAAARARGQQGVVKFAFSIDRQGRVISSRVDQTSGFAALDKAAMETIQKAQPFPRAPAGVSGDEFSFTIPIEFKIR